VKLEWSEEVIGHHSKWLCLSPVHACKCHLDHAQEYNSNWTTAVAMLDDDTYLAAENSFNM
jgi:hypothetical protein